MDPEGDPRRRNSAMSSESERSAMAKAIQWAYRIMAVSLEMVLPGVAGVLLDRFVGSVVVFTLAGFALGFTAAGFHLAAMVRPPKGRTPPSASTQSQDRVEEGTKD
jgi:hypothetical protein